MKIPAWATRLLTPLAFGTMFWAGLQGSDAYWAWKLDPDNTDGGLAAFWGTPAVWRAGLAYAVSLMAILFAHEMGHYLTARRRSVSVSWPIFIPFLPPLGTLGAVIGMRPRPMRARTLLEIAAYGPFAGLIVALPVMIVGLMLSEVRPLPEDFEGLQLGTSLLFGGLERLIFPNVPEGYDVFLHPVALAGWAGCLVTGLNLLPFGQLDGGHIAYAMIGEPYNRWIRKVFYVAMGALVIFNPGFLIFALLVFFLVRVEHPPFVTDGAARGVDRWIGWVALVVFVLTFTPRPFIL